MANPLSNPSSQALSPEAQRQADLQVAQAALQTAARTKDTDPLLYEYARYNYYSKLNGPEWASEEKARITSNQLDPIIQRYRNQRSAIDAEYAGQRDIADTVKALNQEQTNVSNTIQKQLEYIGESVDEKQNRMNLYKRYIELEGGSFAHRMRTRATDKIAEYFGSYPESFFVIVCVINALLLFLLGLIYYKKVSTYIADFAYKMSNVSGIQFAPAPAPVPGPAPSAPSLPIPGAAVTLSLFRRVMDWIGGFGRMIGGITVSAPWTKILVISANIVVLVFVVLGFINASK